MKRKLLFVALLLMVGLLFGCKSKVVVNFDTAGGSPIERVEIKKGSKLLEQLPPAPTKEGYTFDGWYLRGEKVEETDAAEKSITLKAKWIVNEYTVTFDAAGGVEVASVTGDYGTVLERLPITEKASHAFKGWYDGETKVSAPYTIKKNVTLVAKYDAKECVVSFDPAGGTSVEAFRVIYGNSVEELPETERAGYTFLGWYVGDVKAEAPLLIEGYTLLVAKWAAIPYTITFDSKGGTAVEAITEDYGTVVELPEPEKEGYTFDGWFLEDEAVGETLVLKADVALVAKWTAIPYTITFDSKGGSAVADITKDYGTVLNALPATTKEGYTFGGWYDGTTKVEAPYTVKKDAALVAKWTINQYTVTFDTDGGTPIAPLTKDYGYVITEQPVTTKEGYTFGGWYVGETLISGPYTIKANVTAKAKWTINEYTITFDSTGGSEVASITENYGYKLQVLPTATKAGHTFGGWYVGEDKIVVPYTLKADVTFVAKWDVNQYTLTFDVDGGFAIDPITKDYGTVLNTLPTPVRTEHKFDGWFAGTVKVEAPYTITKDAVLKAKWTINQYKVTYDVDGGVAMEPDIYDYNTVLNELPLAVKEGHTFDGWYIGETKVNVPYPVTQNVTFKAHWSINDYTVSFDADGGSAVAAITQTYATVIDPLPETIKEGYTFAGWYLGNVKIEAPYSVPGEDVTLVAHWTINQYKVTFDVAGGDAIDPVTADFGSEITLPTPTKTENVFDGWFIGLEQKTSPYTITAENVTLVAHWTPNQFTVTFDAAGGDAIAPITADYDSQVNLPDGTRTGYTFDGWFIGAQQITSPYTITAENVTLVAKWTINQYTISFFPDGGPAVEPITENYGTKIHGVSPEQTKTGYTFAGWYLGDTKVSFPYTIVADVTFVARWTINQYTITFANTGDAPVTPITENYNTTLNELPVPTKNEHQFNGWYLNGVKVETPYTITQNVTFEAQWTPNQYTVTYDVAGGVAIPAATKDYGSVIDPLPVPVRTGYAFTGWYLDGSLILAPYPVTKDVTLVAHWDDTTVYVNMLYTGGLTRVKLIQELRSQLSLTLTEANESIKAGYLEFPTLEACNAALEGVTFTNIVLETPVLRKNAVKVYTNNMYTVLPSGGYITVDQLKGTFVGSKAPQTFVNAETTEGLFDIAATPITINIEFIYTRWHVTYNFFHDGVPHTTPTLNNIPMAVNNSGVKSIANFGGILTSYGVADPTVPAGSLFMGWAKGSPTGNIVSSTEKIYEDTDFHSVVNADPNARTVTWKYNDGVTPDLQEIYYLTDTIVAPTDPTRGIWEFGGWYYDGGTTKFQAGDTVTDNHEIHAIWMSKVTVHWDNTKVTYKTPGGLPYPGPTFEWTVREGKNIYDVACNNPEFIPHIIPLGDPNKRRLDTVVYGCYDAGDEVYFDPYLTTDVASDATMSVYIQVITEIEIIVHLQVEGEPLVSNWQTLSFDDVTSTEDVVDAFATLGTSYLDEYVFGGLIHATRGNMIVYISLRNAIGDPEVYSSEWTIHYNKIKLTFADCTSYSSLDQRGIDSSRTKSVTGEYVRTKKSLAGSAVMNKLTILRSQVGLLIDYFELSDGTPISSLTTFTDDTTVYVKFKQKTIDIKAHNTGETLTTAGIYDYTKAAHMADKYNFISSSHAYSVYDDDGMLLTPGALIANEEFVRLLGKCRVRVYYWKTASPNTNPPIQAPIASVYVDIGLTAAQLVAHPDLDSYESDLITRIGSNFIIWRFKRWALPPIGSYWIEPGQAGVGFATSYRVYGMQRRVAAEYYPAKPFTP